MLEKIDPIVRLLVLVGLFAGIGYAVAIAMGDANRTSGILIVQSAPIDRDRPIEHQSDLETEPELCIRFPIVHLATPVTPSFRRLR